MINHKYKFVFVLLPKTGTTSILNMFKNNHYLSKDTIAGTGAGRHYDKLSDDELNYLKIATCRNPFSRVVSLWKYWNMRLRWEKIPTVGFSYFVKNYTKMQKKICLAFDKMTEIHFYTCVDGITLSTGGSLSCTDIDLWIKTENLKKDINIACDKIGIPRDQPPHKNQTKHKHYTEYYDDETRQIVAKKYAKDIEYFGYEFGE